MARHALYTATSDYRILLLLSIKSALVSCIWPDLYGHQRSRCAALSRCLVRVAAGALEAAGHPAEEELKHWPAPRNFIIIPHISSCRAPVQPSSSSLCLGRCALCSIILNLSRRRRVDVTGISTLRNPCRLHRHPCVGRATSVRPHSTTHRSLDRRPYRSGEAPHRSLLARFHS